MNKKRIGLTVLLAVFCPILCSCRETESTVELGTYDVYYTDLSGAELKAKKTYIDVNESVESIADELIDKMDNISASDEYVPIKPSNINVNDIQYNNNDKNIRVDFSEGYTEMSNETEVLYRTSLVKTLTQIVGVDSVTITQNGNQVNLDGGLVLVNLKEDDFVNDSFSDNYRVDEYIPLYFANQEGDKLVKEYVDLSNDESVNVEEFVLKRLLEGPKNSDNKKAIPRNVEIRAITNTDGICYINFDSVLLNESTGVSPDITIYSIVNSLCELSDVDGVRIMVDGNFNLYLNNAISLNQTFTYNEEIVE